MLLKLFLFCALLRWANLTTATLLGTAANDLEARQAIQGPCDNSPTSRGCWGEYSIDTDWYEVVPETGVTREVSVVFVFFLGV